MANRLESIRLAARLNDTAPDTTPHPIANGGIAATRSRTPSPFIPSIHRSSFLSPNSIMASAPPAAHSPPARENQSTLHSDPFWHSTPRSNTNVAALMTAVQQVAPPTSLPAPNPTTTPQRFRKPACTHVTMSRVYGPLPCTFCARIPDIGWVYACKQDDLPCQRDPLPDPDAIPVVIPDDCSYFEAKARVAEYLEMSPSVIESIRAGRYDVDQVDKLIAQREKLIKVIKEKENAMQSYVFATPQAAQPPKESIIASVGSEPPQSTATTSLATTPAGKSGNTQSASALTTPAKQDSQPARLRMGCHLTFCHACRPFFGDRMYASFQTVWSGQFADLSPSEVARLPVMKRDIVLKMGLPKETASPVRITRSQPSDDLSSQYAEDADADDEISVDWTQTTHNDNESVSDTLDSSELYPCPGPGQCPVWSRRSGCAYDAGFDDGRRATNHGFLAEHEARRLTPDTSASELQQALSDTPGASSTASSVSLPTTPTTSPLTPLLPTDETFDVALQKRLGRIGKANSYSGEYSPQKPRSTLHYKDSKSSMGSEVEVEGGVALTEEAVETNTPDIVTAT